MNKLTFLILILLLEDPRVLIAFYIINCEQLTPLTYCPPFNSSQWKKRAFCMNCTDGTKYHCCKDYDSPILDCQQGIYDCEPDIFVEGCAEEKFCKKGEEPVLSFVKNQKEVERPELFCELCYNNNRYNSHVNTSSATYSECPYKKINICTHETHKIECGKPSNETSERFCRCDVRNGYYPYSHPDDHPSNGCSFTNYECRNDRPKCVAGQQLLRNYTCAALCKEGFDRPENSDYCVPNPTTSYISKHTKQMSTKTTSILSSSSPTTSTKKSTIIIVSTLPPGLETTTVSRSPDTGLIIGVCVGALCFIALMIFIYVSRKKKGRYIKVPLDMELKISSQQNRAQPDSQSNISHLNENQKKDVNVQYVIQGDYINAKADNIQISKDETGNRLVESNSEGTISRSRTSTSESKLSARKGSQDKRHIIDKTGIRTELQRTLPSRVSEDFQTHSLDRKRTPSLRVRDEGSQSYMRIPKERILDVKDRLNLSDEEYDEFVPSVLLKSQAEMVTYLHIDILLDFFAKSGVFVGNDLRDISEEKNTSDKIRKLLRRLKEKGVDSYMPFKESLLSSEQEMCLKVLEKQELIVYKTIMAKRQNSEKANVSSSCEELNETDERTFYGGHLSENRASPSSSDGFEPVSSLADIEQNNGSSEYLKSMIGGSVGDDRTIKDRDEEQQLEDQAKLYLKRLASLVTDFNIFMQEVELVKEDMDEKCSQLLECPSTTVTNLECTEEEEDSPDGFQAYKSSGSSNSCLYQSVSILLRGDEQLQHRLRLKTTLHCCKEMANYIKLFTTYFQHEKIDTVKQFFYNNVSAETWERISEMNGKEDIIEESLQALITETACIGTDSSRLHVKFLSDALGMQIEQHFQLEKHFGESETLIPWQPIENVFDTKCLHIYWIDTTGKREKMNHIVPLL